MFHAFFIIGVSGMTLLFYRWRLAQDDLARGLFLIALALWILTLLLLSTSRDLGYELDQPTFWTAMATFLVSVPGAFVVVVREFFRGYQRNGR